MAIFPFDFARKSTHVAAAGYSSLIRPTAESSGGPYIAGSIAIGVGVNSVVASLGLAPTPDLPRPAKGSVERTCSGSHSKPGSYVAPAGPYAARAPASGRFGSLRLWWPRCSPTVLPRVAALPALPDFGRLCGGEVPVGWLLPSDPGRVPNQWHDPDSDVASPL